MQCGTFCAAARKLGITQQALSFSIQSLEREFGVTLVRRRRGGCMLTEEGNIFLAYAQKCLDDHERILSYFAERQAAGSLHDLDLFTYSFVSDCLFDTIRDFQAERSDMRITVRFMEEHRFMRRLRAHDRGDSLFLCTIPFVEDEEPIHRFMFAGADTHIIKKNYYIACVGKHSLLSQETVVSVNDLLRLPFILPREKKQACTPLQHVLEQYGTPNIVQTIPSLFSWTQSLRRNVGVSLMQESLVQPGRVQRRLAEHVRFIPLKEKIGAYQCVVLPPRPSRKAMAFVHRLEQALEVRGCETEKEFVPVLFPGKTL
ncbi:LysR family transcriptional regulator [Mailhella massiliensis]|uniref:LysR family transcriptional regulator n=1 Tax=Mailhella massiliensis TaxID=1903261 RepID=UPI00350E551C